MLYKIREEILRDIANTVIYAIMKLNKQFFFLSRI